MPILLENRGVAGITVVTCSGRIVEGSEAAALKRLLDDLLPFSPHLILHLGGVDFVDSSGLGLLARYASRTRNAHGSLKLCAVPAKLTEVLRVTHLDRVFETYPSEAEAIAAFHRGVGADSRSTSARAGILCVDASLDIQAYVRELLGQAGYGIFTAGNTPDALVLLQATQPRLVIVGAAMRAQRDTKSGEKFNRLADAMSVIELPAEFSRVDAGEAAERLLEQVRARLEPA